MHLQVHVVIFVVYLVELGFVTENYFCSTGNLKGFEISHGSWTFHKPFKIVNSM